MFVKKNSGKQEHIISYSKIWLEKTSLGFIFSAIIPI